MDENKVRENEVEDNEVEENEVEETKVEEGDETKKEAELKEEIIVDENHPEVRVFETSSGAGAQSLSWFFKHVRRSVVVI